MIKPVEFHLSNLYCPLILWVSLLIMIACESMPPIEGPPSLSASLSVDGQTHDLAHLIKRLAADRQGASAIRRALLVEVLSQRSEALGELTPPPDQAEWRTRLPEVDKQDALLYAWASQILHLKSTADEPLRARYQVEFPRGYKLIGRQINLSPKIAWTEDHYQRHLGGLRSAARLKLSQLRHQLIEGSNFEVLARQESHHSTRSRGGEVTIDDLRAEGIAPRILRVVSELRAGEVSPVLQDEQGMYIFTNNSQERPASIDAEGIFIPKTIINTRLLESTEFWQLMETLCDQSNQCDLSELLPSGDVGRVWREAWKKHSSISRLSSKERARKQRKRRRLNRKAKGDTRSLAGRERSWSSIPLSIHEKVNAEYHQQVSHQVFMSLQSRDAAQLIERAPLFKALPVQLTERGAWLLRLRGRTIIPALSTPSLRMIYLNLTREGLKKHWGTWGVDQIGQLLTEATQHHRLDEALSTLGIQATEIDPKSLPSTMVNRLLDVSLDSGPQMVSSKVDAKQATQDWILIKLEKRQAISFKEARESLIKGLQREKTDPKALKFALKELWESIEIELFIDHQEIKLDSKTLRDFTR